ncbi:hypothetical protein [Streptomyces purpurogeneiscleroticus]|nr:hypothetical protein ADL19_13555 [Streptomyces purpurogeneiscleroticus]
MSGKSKQLSFVADEETLALINELKKELKAPTTTAVFRKALAIARVAAEQAREANGVVTVTGKGQPAGEGVSIALQA